MLFDSLLDAPFYEGTGLSTLVPGLYLVAIDSHPYVVDFSDNPSRRDLFRHRSIPLLRPQADTSNLPSEGSLNPAALWRRSAETWHKGAGQRYFDRDDSDSARFYASKGVDVWTRWQLSLLPDTAQRLSSAATNLNLASTSTHLYVTDGTALKYSTDITGSSWTTVTGTPATAATSITSDGFNVWTAHVTDGLYKTTRGAATTANVFADDLASNTVIGYVKGRLMASIDNKLYNITTAALPAALLTHPNTDFVWTGFAEGPAHIYAAGYSGDRSLIFKTAVVAEGTALAVPTVAGELPDGEIVRAIQGYLGFLVIGTDTGFRLAEIDTNGNLNIGARVATTSAVRCFEPQDRFVWYGLTNYDSTSSGLGRMDLSVLNETAPAYASDLMVTGQAIVRSVVTFANQRVFAINALGIYTSSADLVASGTLDSGLVSYGISDAKIAVFCDLTTAELVGSYTASLSMDGGAFGLLGTETTAGSVTAEFPCPQDPSHNFEVRLTLNRDAVTTTGPTFYRFTLRANPTSKSGYEISVPLRLHEELLVGDQEVASVPSAELAFLDDLRVTRRIVQYQEGGMSYSVTVEDVDLIFDSIGRDGTEINGVCVLTVKTLV